MKTLAATAASFALALTGAGGVERPGCETTYTLTQFHQAAKSTYAGASAPRRSKQRALARIIRCQRSERKEARARKFLRGYKYGHRLRVEFAGFKANPMPRCTWFNESGTIRESGPEWPPSRRRYTIPNASGSAASGKYQIMDGTWVGYGGTRRGRHSAAKSPPREQERIARRIYRAEGTSPWSGCR